MKTFKHPRSDMYVEVDEITGWASIKDTYGSSISLGGCPNARSEVLLEAIKYSEEINKKRNKKK